MKLVTVEDAVKVTVSASRAAAISSAVGVSVTVS